MFCNFCNTKKCQYRCSACNVTAYCSKECQKNDWKKVHKWECVGGVVNDSSKKVVDNARKSLAPGQFCILASKAKGNYGITMGYEATRISKAASIEFEEAVAAVDASGVTPPTLEEPIEATIVISIFSFNNPFFVLIWLAEAAYGADADPTILRVQEMASKLTNAASNMLHLLIQPCVESLTPNLSCKCRGVDDVDVAVESLTKNCLLDSTFRRWAPLTLTQLLKLLERFCRVDKSLLDRVWRTKQRVLREKTWEHCDEELAALRDSVGLIDVFKASSELLDLMVELTRRASFDGDVSVSVRTVRSILALHDDKAGPTVRDGSVSFGLDDDSLKVVAADKVYEYVESALQTAEEEEEGLVYSVVTPDGIERCLAGSLAAVGDPLVVVEPMFRRSKGAQLERLPTLLQPVETITNSILKKCHGSVLKVNIRATIRVALSPPPASGLDDGMVRDLYLDGLVDEELVRLRQTAAMNAHLIMSRLLRVDKVGVKTAGVAGEETQEDLREAAREAAVLYLYSRSIIIASDKLSSNIS